MIKLPIQKKLAWDSDFISSLGKYGDHTSISSPKRASKNKLEGLTVQQALDGKKPSWATLKGIG